MKKHNLFSSILGLIFGVTLIIVGVIIIIPLLGGYGIAWTICALSIIAYNGYNIICNKKISFWEEDN